MAIPHACMRSGHKLLGDRPTYKIKHAKLYGGNVTKTFY